MSESTYNDSEAEFYDSELDYEDDTFYDSDPGSEEETFDIKRDQLLQPHQKDVLRYIVSKCKNQHGILVNHYQGTGKTITGIYFLKNYSKYKKVIIGPSALKNMWKTEASINKVTKNIYYISYDELEEAVEYPDKVDKINNILKDAVVVADEVHNMLGFMNGTQENTNYIEFKKSWQKKKSGTEEEREYLKSYLNFFKIPKKVLFLTGTPIKEQLSDIRWFINLSAGKTVVPYNETSFMEKYSYKAKYVSFYEKITPLLKMMNMEYINLENFKMYSTEFKDILSEILPSVGNNLLDSTIRNIIVENLTQNATYYGKKYMYETLDKNKIDWGNYISFYKYENIEYFPSSKIITRAVNYTDYQLTLLNNFYTQRSLPKDFVDMGIYETLEDAEIFLGYSKGNDTDLQLRNASTIVENETEDIPKFRGILDDYNQYKQNTLVYSNSYVGLIRFSKYLESRGVKHNIYDDNLSESQEKRLKSEFQNGSSEILLLHPKFYEGFSLNNVRRFHILEPVESSLIAEQLYTRVIRFKSHYNLPIDQRNVTIIQWYATMNSIVNKINTLRVNVKNQNFDFNNIKFSGGPEDNLMYKLDIKKTFFENISHVLKDISIERNEKLKDLNDTCCIYGDYECINLPQCDHT